LPAADLECVEVAVRSVVVADLAAIRLGALSTAVIGTNAADVGVARGRFRGREVGLGVACVDGEGAPLVVLNALAPAGGALTVWIRIPADWALGMAELLGVLLASPLYSAMIECWPAASAEVVSAALPLLIVLVPSSVAPSRNETVPVKHWAWLVTFAVKVTASPVVDGFVDEVTEVVDDAWGMAFICTTSGGALLVPFPLPSLTMSGAPSLLRSAKVIRGES
jgi:hypothetical protein